jgi:hypothetical protein
MKDKVIGTGKDKGKVVPVHAMKTYRGKEV